MLGGGDGQATFQELRSVNMLSFFDQELRPVFCVDIQDDTSSDNLTPVFQNTFLRVSGIWAKLVPPSTPVLLADDAAYHFVNWARSELQSEVESSRFLRYEGIHWQKTTVLDRWRIISGTFCSDPVRSPLVESEEDKLEGALQDAQRALLGSVTEQGYRELSKPDGASEALEESWAVDRGHIVGKPESADLKWDSGGLEKPAGYPPATASSDWLDNFDWNSSPLGPRDTWDPQLKRMVKLMLADPLPAAAYWGPEKTTLYNEHYRWILARKHPSAMGRPFCEVWGEVNTAFQTIFKQAAADRKAITSDDTEFHIERDGFIEQTYFSWSMMPISDDDDQVVGYYNPARETTVQKTLYRRMSLLLGLSQGLGLANTVDEFWPQVVNALDVGTHDVPFLLLYGANGLDQQCSDLFQEEQREVRRWKLTGTIGYPKDLDSLPHVIDYDDHEDDMALLVDRVKSAREPVVVSTTDGSFPARLMTTIHTRSYGEKCSKAIFCPIRPHMAAASSGAGFILLGLNPRRPYDDDYKLFVQLLMRQMASSMAAVLLFTDTVRRGEQRAKSLSRQLATQTKIAEDNEIRFQRMADHAPVAMFKIGADGRLEYGNDDYFELTESSPTDKTPWLYRKAVHEDHQSVATRQWDSLSVDLAPVNNEMRLKKRWSTPDGEVGSTWVVAAAYPEFDPEGNLMSVLGCLTDISRQKWAEEIQARRTEQAIELKRQQELWIDMTSHELRNPLSAVIQCADGILSAFDQPEVKAVEQFCISASDAASVVDAAQTIIFCAQHQKRITDDVLILSKLNSDLVVITPIDLRPVEMIQGGLRVFDRELKKSKIQLSINAAQSYHELGIESVRLDPSRMLQVLINLVSNAIKFTEPQARRQIDVRFGASLTPNFEELDDIRFWDNDIKQADTKLQSEEWGDGEIVYLFISVHDTGRGLREDEMDYLFQRFSQVSPRTHIQYGGSGLGLFISKRLAEAQGGAIGVSSVPEQGSTFAFYIKTRRSPLSAVPEHVLTPVSDTVIIGDERQIRVSIPAESNTRLPPGLVDADSSVSSPASSKGISPFSPLSSFLSRNSSDQKTVEPLTQGGPLHVLIVEDNLVNQKVLAKQLAKAGYIVAIANHGREALDHLALTAFWKAPPAEDIHAITAKSTRPCLPRRTSSRLSAESDHLGLSAKSSVSRTASNASNTSRAVSDRSETSSNHPDDRNSSLRLDVVLMDLEMPVMDGITCVKRIRELQGEGKLGRVPIIAVTANARQEQIDAAMAAGMDSVVCKPFRIPQLMKEIDATLKKTAGEVGEAKE